MSQTPPPMPPGAAKALSQSIEAGWNRMVWMLFTGPHATFTNWLWWGLMILLAGLNPSGGGGGGGSGPNVNLGSDNEWGGQAFPELPDFDFDPEWFATGAGISALIGCGCVIFGLILLWILVNCVFRIVMIEGVVRGEPRFAGVMQQAIPLGLQYLLFLVLFAVAASLILIVPILLIWLPVMRETSDPGPLRVVATLLFAGPVAVLIGLFHLFVYDLALPIGWRKERGLIDSIGQAVRLATSNVVSVVLYLIARVVIGVVGVIVSVIVCCCTFPIWIIPGALIVMLLVPSVLFPPLLLLTVPLMLLLGLSIGWISATLIAPIPLFYRSWSYAFVYALDSSIGPWDGDPMLGDGDAGGPDSMPPDPLPRSAPPAPPTSPSAGDPPSYGGGGDSPL